MPAPPRDTPDKSAPDAVRTVRRCFDALGCRGELISYPAAVTRPDQMLRILDTDPAAIAGTQLFSAAGRPVLVVVSGTFHADPIDLAALLSAEVGTVSDHLAHSWTGQDPRAIAPVGHPRPIDVVIDVELSRQRQIWVPAGHPDFLFRTAYDELLRVTAGTAAEVGELPDLPPARRTQT